MLIRFVSIVAVCAALTTAGRAQSVLFSDDFEAGLGGWTVTHPASCGAGLSCSGGVTWSAISDDADCAGWALPFPSGSQCAHFGHPQNCNYDGGPSAAPTAELRSVQSIALPSGAASLRLRFFTKSEAEDNGSDQRTVEIDYPGLSAPTVIELLTSSGWHEENLDLTPYAGNSVQLIFRFRCLDASNNTGHGLFVDDVRVEFSTSSIFCAGDGTWAPCPCGNFGATGHGCASSFNPQGAQITGNGSQHVSADSMTLTATGLSNSAVLVFQGTLTQSGGAGTAFGDGLRCAAGFVVRLKTVQPTGGTVQFPGPTDPQLHTAGQVPPAGGTRTYQVWYRNVASFCTPSTFNLTNGLQIVWLP
jgi:hypothetical protein